MQVPSPAAGVIEELLVPDGGKVEGGTPLFKLRKGGFKYFIFTRTCSISGVIKMIFLKLVLS